jgi:hypothetical protein
LNGKGHAAPAKDSDENANRFGNLAGKEEFQWSTAKACCAIDRLSAPRIDRRELAPAQQQQVRG